MVSVLLDTCAWLWWVSDPVKLTAKARRAIEAAQGGGHAFVSEASVWELTLKTPQKLGLKQPLREWVDLAAQSPGVKLKKIKRDDLLSTAELPDWRHRDPFDRLMVVVARRLNVPIITSDDQIRHYPHVQSIW